MMVFSGWVGVKNPYILWSLRVLVASVFFYTVFKLQAKHKLLYIPKKIVYIFALGLVSSFIPIKQIFYLFAAGYDNSSHVGFLFRTWEIGSFEYGAEGNGKNLPAYINLANGYPSLQMQTWASILHVLNLQIDNTDQLLRYFFFFSILSILLLLYVMYTYCPRISKSNLMIKICLTFFVFLSSISSIFWSGFPPTIWGIIVVLIGVRVLIAIDYLNKSHLIWSALSFVISLYAYQLFSFSLLVIYLFLLVRIFLTNSISKKYMISSVSFFVIIVPGYLLLNVSREIKNYVFAQGGIILPSVFLVVFLIVLVLIGFINNEDKFAENFLLFIALSSSTILSILLLVNAFFQDKGVYYPAKLLYLSIFLMISYLLWIIGKSRVAQPFNSINLFSATLAIMIISTSLSLMSQSKEIWFGSSINLIRSVDALRSGDYAPFNPGCLQSVFDGAVMAENFNQQKNLIVVRTEGSQSDLISRWANSLNGRIDNNVIEFGMSLNPDYSFNLSIEKFKEKYPNENLIVLKSLPGCISSD